MYFLVRWNPLVFTSTNVLPVLLYCYTIIRSVCHFCSSTACVSRCKSMLMASQLPAFTAWMIELVSNRGTTAICSLINFCFNMVAHWTHHAFSRRQFYTNEERSSSLALTCVFWFYILDVLMWHVACIDITCCMYWYYILCCTDIICWVACTDISWCMYWYHMYLIAGSCLFLAFK